MRIGFCFLMIFWLLGIGLQAQTPIFTRADTLRGTVTHERAWWDLTFYELFVKVEPKEKYISGSNIIHYKVLKPASVIQIDLQEPLQIVNVTQHGQSLSFVKDGNAWFITLKEEQNPGEVNEIKVYYNGKPHEALKAPWDGGLTWSSDPNGRDFIATSCQGIGASLWWPCKDHMYDEPDSMKMTYMVPDSLFAVGNGRLRKIEAVEGGYRTFEWFVSNPINNYGVSMSVGDYVHFGEQYQGENGNLDCDYYVLRDHLEKAKIQFKDARRMLEAFEHWFGPYPFYEDSYKLVEVPYLGMEHQSCVTYGNGYKNGYKGRDLSETGWGLKFDFIIIHESGHEWFANNITYKDIADMWIHESFTAYSEGLFLEYFYGKQAGAEYVIGTKLNIINDRPIIGMYGVNYGGSGDMYYKGANMLHTLRQWVNDDNKWRAVLRGLNKEFYHQTVTTAQIGDYISQHTGLPLQSFFNQYLRDTRIPVLEYKIRGKKLYYRWTNCNDHFNLPVNIGVGEATITLKPITGKWKKIRLDSKPMDIKVPTDYLIDHKKVK
ncbi:MAG: M1 family metallopeptidase [Saprospiraceae bacterium]|nr:MAG: peptidase M1 membrane alanine aminopeptidase [Bacteroidetes bacterium OLB9]MCO6462707.1 M1 family metallopeptidase [Saprospiraceae bacterium]